VNKEDIIIADESVSINLPPEPNFEWSISGDFKNGIVFHSIVKRTLFNRFKWWLGTKICIPGSYRWTE